MVEISPLRINCRPKQGDVCDIINDSIQSLMVVCCLSISLRKSVATVHLKTKSSTIISHKVVNQIYVINVLSTKFIAPFDSKIMYLFHVWHCGTPPIHIILFLSKYLTDFFCQQFLTFFIKLFKMLKF